MKLLRSPIESWSVDRSLGLAVGVFDGVHRGHRHVLEILQERAATMGLAPGVLTFDPHPLAVLAPERAPLRLTTIQQRLEQFSELGIEVVAVLPFTDEVRSMSPESFVSEILVERLSAGLVVAGEDFRFGSRRAGDVALLAALGPELGYQMVSSELIGDAEPVSSTAIRDALAAGEVERAARLLGRPFELETQVGGEQMLDGSMITSPGIDPTLAKPGDGLYAGSIGGAVAAISMVGGAATVISDQPLVSDRIVFRARLGDRPGEPAADLRDAVSGSTDRRER